jgi:predicted nucleic acid-binding protein
MDLVGDRGPSVVPPRGASDPGSARSGCAVVVDHLDLGGREEGGKEAAAARPTDARLDQATRRAGLKLAELTPAILIDSCDLPQPFHGDPADQIIVATARHERAVLVTKDRNLRRYPHVQTVW